MKKLAELADVTVGFVGTMTPHYRDSGVPFLRSQNVTPHAVDLSDLKFISPEFDQTIQKSALSPGDVVIVRTGKPGTAAVIPASVEHANCADLVVVRPGPKLDPRWFSYFMNSVARHAVAANTVGAVHQHFNVGAAKALELPNVSLRDQERVAEVLGALDDKIAANRRVQRSIDDLLESAFRKASASATESVELGDLIVLNYGKSLPASKRVEGLVPVVGSGGIVGYHDQSLVGGPAVVVGRKGSVGATYWISEDCFPIDTTYWVSTRSVSLGYSYQLLQSIDFLAMNTDSAVPGLNRDRAYALRVPLPSSEQLEEFDRLGDVLTAKHSSLEAETTVLDRARNELLPMLMSGRITVKDAERAAESVL